MLSEFIQPLLSGIGAGLVLAIVIGPVFFALLQASIEKGFVAGVVFALGIVLSDALFFLLAYFSLSQFNIEGDSVVQEIMGFVGGLIIIVFGILLLRRRPGKKNGIQIASRGSLLRSMAKAFLLNALNPFVFLYWASVVGTLVSEYDGNTRDIFAFFVMCMLTVFGTDMLKAYLAQKLKMVITETFMLWLNRLAGAGLVITGAVVIYRTADLFGML